MSVRITNDSHTVALYDSVTGTAFGPIFDNAEDADHFLEYVALNDDRDPRTIPAQELVALRDKWGENR